MLAGIAASCVLCNTATLGTVLVANNLQLFPFTAAFAFFHNGSWVPIRPHSKFICAFRTVEEHIHPIFDFDWSSLVLEGSILFFLQLLWFTLQEIWNFYVHFLFLRPLHSYSRHQAKLSSHRIFSKFIAGNFRALKNFGLKLEREKPTVVVKFIETVVMV